MPEIFDKNRDWIIVLLSKEPKQSHLFTFYAAPSVGLLLHQSKGILIHSQNIFFDIFLQLKTVNKHSTYIGHLHVVTAHLLLKGVEASQCDAHRYFAMKESFGKFLTTRPCSYNDEKLFLEIVDFLTLMLECSKDFDLPWIKNLIEIVSINFGVFSRIILRSEVDCGQQFLVPKGQEKVENLMSCFIAKMPQKDRKELKKILIENFVESKSNFNIFLLKVLSELTVSEKDSNNSVEQKLHDQFFEILVEEFVATKLKSDILDKSGLCLWMTICVYNLVSFLKMGHTQPLFVYPERNGVSEQSEYPYMYFMLCKFFIGPLAEAVWPRPGLQ